MIPNRIYVVEQMNPYIDLIKVEFFDTVAKLARTYHVPESDFEDEWDRDCGKDHSWEECTCKCSVSGDEFNMIWVLTWEVDAKTYIDILSWPGDYACGQCYWDNFENHKFISADVLDDPLDHSRSSILTGSNPRHPHRLKFLQLADI